MTLNDKLALLIDADGLPTPEREWRFAKPRRWRWDFSWKEKMVALEVQGGGHVYGRHHRPAGYERDCEKANEGVLLGWRVLRVTGAMVDDGRALALLHRILKEGP